MKVCLNGHEWLARLPHPFWPKVQAAGSGYALSIRQAGFPLTRVFDRPQTGRQGVEEVNCEILDLGRPDRVLLIFGRRVTGRTPFTRPIGLWIASWRRRVLRRRSLTHCSRFQILESF